MSTILAQQATASSEISQLDTFLKYGQMGLALAILVVGAGLFTAAVKQQNLSETTARVLKLFATVMVVLFVVSFLGEMATKVMDFLDQRRAVVTTIEVSPFTNKKTYQDYGPVEITIVDTAAPSQAAPVHADHVLQFHVHDRTQFHIELGNLIDQLKTSQNLADSAIAQAAKPNTLGSGTTK
jgi:hypothetical protein